MAKPWAAFPISTNVYYTCINDSMETIFEQESTKSLKLISLMFHINIVNHTSVNVNSNQRPEPINDST